MSDKEKIYACLFVNSRSTRVSVWDYGRVLFTLEPGAEFETEMYDPKAYYARFKKVIFLEGDKVDLKENHAWENPWKGQWTLELHNIDGAPVEALIVDGQTVHVYKGIPRIVPISIQDPFAQYKKVEWKLVQEKKRRSDFPDYVKVELRLDRVMEKRSERDIRKIREQLEHETLEQAQDGVKRKLRQLGIDDEPLHST
jgi:hypothetical protein